jgi:chemotaxis protein methyltransferase CheR
MPTFSDAAILSETLSPGIPLTPLACLQRWIHRATGIVLNAHSTSLLEPRLVRLAEREGLRGLDSLYRELRSGRPGLSRLVIEAATNHETFFFRDRAAFSALRSAVVPRLLASRPPNARLNIWSAAASSGQEAYSVAMLLLECGVAASRVSILGTDLSGRILDRAREAVYGGFEISRGVPPDRLSRFFDPPRDNRGGPEYRVREYIREMVRFQQDDLRGPLRERGPFDLILCRNVLIYFDEPTRADVLRSVRAVMAPSSFLVLGTAETVGGAPGFERIDMGEAVAYSNS